MYSDDDMIMISSLQHFVFCQRQCALIHLEQVWEENYLTASGSILHEHVDKHGHETRKGIHTATAIRIVSHKLGLTGIADIIEFHQMDTATADDGTLVAVKLPRLKMFWKPFPVEYKRGKPKAHRADEVQLCAQAICLEEMLNVKIECGALFYGKQRRRTGVVFDSELRSLTQDTVDAVHRLLNSGKTPSSEYSKACEACSLIEICRPQSITSGRSARRWLEKSLKDTLT